jgi:RNA 3'-terminal phosphate cyclase (ATP)
VIFIDGSHGEGGGQILRTSLALSMVTGRPFRIEKIRAGRKKPGLLRQHLTAVNAAAAVSGAKVTGAHIGAQTLEFSPGAVRAADYSFAVGTAGSATLVLQTILPALMTASGASRVTVEGGTHNPAAPPFDFLVKAFLPLLNRMGAAVSAELVRPGFYPAGGGRIRVSVNPVKNPQPLDLTHRGDIQGRRVRAVIAHLPQHIARRELDFVARKLSWPQECFEMIEMNAAPGQGNVLFIEIESAAVTEVFTGFGEQGVLAEVVAGTPVAEARAYLASQAAVAERLADQLPLPMMLCAGGTFTTLPLSRHAATNLETIRQFADAPVVVSKTDGRLVRVEIGRLR